MSHLRRPPCSVHSASPAPHLRWRTISRPRLRFPASPARRHLSPSFTSCLPICHQSGAPSLPPHPAPATPSPPPTHTHTPSDTLASSLTPSPTPDNNLLLPSVPSCPVVGRGTSCHWQRQRLKEKVVKTRPLSRRRRRKSCSGKHRTRTGSGAYAPSKHTHTHACASHEAMCRSQVQNCLKP